MLSDEATKAEAGSGHLWVLSQQHQDPQSLSGILEKIRVCLLFIAFSKQLCEVDSPLLFSQTHFEWVLL
jgi:hypothetical protein